MSNAESEWSKQCIYAVNCAVTVINDSLFAQKSEETLMHTAQFKQLIVQL